MRINNTIIYKGAKPAKIMTASKEVKVKDNAVRTTAPLSAYSLSQVSFGLIFKNQNESFEQFLEEEGKVTLEDYKNIKKQQPYIINKAKVYYAKIKKEEELKITPNYAARAAFLYKKYLDDKYGKGAYRIISVGTSPAFITQIMSQDDCEVIYAPASSVPMTDNPLKNKKLKQLAQYLKKNHCDNNKINIIMDFASSYTTIMTIELLIASAFHTPDEKLKIFPIRHELLCKAEVPKKDKIHFTIPEAENFISDISYEKVAILSNVPHFPVLPEYKNFKNYWEMTDNKTQFREFDKFSQPEARAFTLLSLDELDKIKQ